jgi:transcriptional regulator with XRE-family HTH domain
MTQANPPTLAEVFGRRIKSLREAQDLSQEDIAIRARANGLNWTRATVASIETGRRDSIGVEELLLISDAIGAPPVAWFAGKGEATIAKGVAVPLEQVRYLLTTKHRGPRDLDLRVYDQKVAMTVMEAFARETGAVRWVPGEAELKAARKLGVRPGEIDDAAQRLWKRSLTEERDRRVEEIAPAKVERSSLQAMRGHVTRSLLTEIEAELARRRKRRRRL